jgi:hypothetical protein
MPDQTAYLIHWHLMFDQVTGGQEFGICLMGPTQSVGTARREEPCAQHVPNHILANAKSFLTYALDPPCQRVHGYLGRWVECVTDTCINDTSVAENRDRRNAAGNSHPLIRTQFAPYSSRSAARTRLFAQ